MSNEKWYADDLRAAFVAGAAWWEFLTTDMTMWPADKDKAESEAERRYPGGSGRLAMEKSRKRAGQ